MIEDFYDDVQADLVDSTEEAPSDVGDFSPDFVEVPEMSGEDLPSESVSPPSDSEAPSVSEEVPSVDLPSQEDFSSSDRLDSFLAGVLAGVSSGSSAEAADDDVAFDDGWEFVGIETFALSPIESSTGLKGVLLDVVGPYDNIVTQYQYRQNTSSNYSYVNEITPDYPWIASALLFIALILSLFSLVRRSFAWMR